MYSDANHVDFLLASSYVALVLRCNKVVIFVVKNSNIVFQYMVRESQPTRVKPGWSFGDRVKFISTNKQSSNANLTTAADLGRDYAGIAQLVQQLDGSFASIDSNRSTNHGGGRPAMAGLTTLWQEQAAALESSLNGSSSRSTGSRLGTNRATQPVKRRVALTEDEDEDSLIFI
jgi:hypothetical protein